MRDHTQLRAFILADEVALEIYQLTKAFPKEEIYGLSAQMRRAGVSVPSNIVEGCSRESESEFIRYLEIAFGSLRELHYQFDLSRRLGYGAGANSVDAIGELLCESERVLGALLRSTRKRRKG